MTNGILTLKCKNCGSNLEVSPGMDQFNCAYCGAELLVQRKGGTIALKIVEEAIKKVQVGTDKAAAELAIARYDKSLKELEQESLRLKSNVYTETLLGYGCGGFLLLIGVGAMVGDSGGVGCFWIILGVGCCLLCLYGLIKPKKEKIKEVDSKIEDVKSKIHLKNEIADS